MNNYLRRNLGRTYEKAEDFPWEVNKEKLINFCGVICVGAKDLVLTSSILATSGSSPT